MWGQLHLLAYRFLRRQGLAHADAEDLAQETLVTAYMHLDGVASGKVEAWIVTVARNKLRDWARRQARCPEVFGVADEPVDSDPSVDPVLAALQSLERSEIGAHLSALPARDRTVLELRYLRNLSTAEVAEEMSLSVSTTKVAIHRARIRLRGAIETARRSS